MHSVVTLCALLAGLSLATAARPEALTPAPRCAVAPSPDDVLRVLNATRARGAACQPRNEALSAAPLKWSASLAEVAEAQSRAMAELHSMTHRDSQGRGLTERLAAMGYRFSTAAENVAVGYESFDAVMGAWLDSADHCANLMNAKVLELGLACVDAGVGHGAEAIEARYWTLVLGAPPRPR